MAGLVTLSRVLVLSCAVLAPAGWAAAQDVPRTSTGKADLSGTWTSRTLTPLERPGSQPRLVLTREEADKLAGRTTAFFAADGKRTDPNAPPPQASGDPGGYNAFWVDPGEYFSVVRGEIRASGIVEPANGRIPYRDRAAATVVQRKIGQEYVSGRGDYTDPEDLPLRERCLIGFGNTGGPGMLGSLYNNTYEFVQTERHMVMLIEMVHDVRIIPIFDNAEAARGAHRPSAIMPWLGDSVGWWEGDTFVMETMNVHPTQSAESSIPLTKDGRIVERFTRVGKGEIFYAFEVTDPNLYTQTWKAEYTLSAPKGRVYEYACHEGNYAMEGILGGARLAEKEAAGLAASGGAQSSAAVR
jgi:hypothetical protein